MRIPVCRPERPIPWASSSRWNTPLDEIREAVEAGLARGAAAGGYTVEVVYKNAQGDPTAIRTIAEQFAAQGVDVIVPIATGAAQGAAAAAQDVPIVFSAVADPVAAGLLDAFDRTTGNITGVSNGIDVAKNIRFGGRADARHRDLRLCIQ